MQGTYTRQQLIGSIGTSLSADAFPRGFVLDGIQSNYVTSELVLRTTLEGVGLMPVIPKAVVPDPPTVQQGSGKPQPKKTPAGKAPPAQTAPPPAVVQEDGIPEEWMGDNKVIVLTLSKGPSDPEVEQDRELNPAFEANRSRKSTPQGTQRRPTSSKGNIAGSRSKQSMAAPSMQGDASKRTLHGSANSRPGTQRAESKAAPVIGELVSDAPGDAEEEMRKDCAELSSGEQWSEPVPPPLDPVEVEWAKHQETVRRLNRAVLGKPAPSNSVVVRDAPCNALSTEGHLMQQVSPSLAV
jgi:hypothetical protein